MAMRSLSSTRGLSEEREMASNHSISRQSNATVSCDHNESQKPRIEDILKNNSEAETSATTSTNEEKIEKLEKLAPSKEQESRQPQTTAQVQEKRQQERLREALDKELDDLDLPKLEDQVKRIPRKGKNLDWVPDSIVITNKDYDDDDESDNCSLISGLSLPQEISLLRQIADKHHHTQKKEKKSSSSSHKKKTSRKTRNKVASSQIASKSADVTAPPRRRNSRPTTDAGDLKPDRAQNLEIEVAMNGQTLKGSYSGALSQTVPRKPNGAGIIKFDNGDMYMGDMKDGQMHGHGTLVNGDTVLRGEFEHNMFVV